MNPKTFWLKSGHSYWLTILLSPPALTYVCISIMGLSVTELLGWISSHAFLRGDANGDFGDLLVFLFNHLFFLLTSGCCFKE